MIYLFLSMLFIFIAIFIYIYHLLVTAHPSAEYGKKLTLMDRVKEVVAVHKHLMKINFLNRKLNVLWAWTCVGS